MKNIKENMIMEREMTGFSGAGGQQKELHPQTRDAAAHAVAPKKKKPYERLTVSEISIDIASPILAASIVTSTQIMSTGHELGPTFDMSSDATVPGTGKDFSHEWGEGTGF